MWSRLINVLFLLVCCGLTTVSVPAIAQEKVHKLALISDIHFNPFEPASLSSLLAARPVEDWTEIFATIDNQKMSTWGEDTNFALLDSSLRAFAANTAGVELTFLVGDILAHEFEKKASEALGASITEEEARKLKQDTAIFVGERLAAQLPGRPIIFALGNNDSDCGDYQITPKGGFLSGTREMVRKLVGSELLTPGFDKTYSAGGYYVAQHPQLSDTKILVLNDVLWSEKYRNACGEGGDTAGHDMLNWLRDQLSRQEAAGGKVWLVHHIPWGIDAFSTNRSSKTECTAKTVPFLREPFSTEFLNILRKFSATVTTSIAGHTHMDDYRLLSGAGSVPLIAQKIVPAISPIYHQNPGFSVAGFTSGEAAIVDFSTYALGNLESASLSVPGEWREEYVFSETYGLSKYSTQSVAELIAAIEHGGEAETKYRLYFQVGHGNLPSEDMSAYLCAMKALEPDSFARCYCDNGSAPPK
ncbi:metallophosphoesterase [Roseibium sp. SCP14]|uniref:metallophosphoesterase n=1 Tax=Roseibium sp. SCP14 TaxID=3141375 RepID=UPI00333DF762